MLFTSERHGGPATSVQALNGTNTGMKTSDISKNNLLGKEVEVTTYFINVEKVQFFHILILKLAMEL